MLNAEETEYQKLEQEYNVKEWERRRKNIICPICAESMGKSRRGSPIFNCPRCKARLVINIAEVAKLYRRS